MKLSLIKDIVGTCLAEDESTRNSDWKLYVKVCSKMGLKINEITLSNIYENAGNYPTFESISRARRLYQSKGMYQADVDVRHKRLENTKEYIKEFA